MFATPFYRRSSIWTKTAPLLPTIDRAPSRWTNMAHSCLMLIAHAQCQQSIRMESYIPDTTPSTWDVVIAYMYDWVYRALWHRIAVSIANPFALSLTFANLQYSRFVGAFKTFAVLSNRKFSLHSILIFIFIFHNFPSHFRCEISKVCNVIF